jgi:ligand-binding sensor domain-containing protein/two-component sensor histidine kinase
MTVRPKTFLFLAALCLCLSADLAAQQYTFLKYSVREGLAQSQVRSLFQDSRGYLWAGTLGGISRFDGRHFVNFGRAEGLSSNQVSAFAELPDGRIAAGSVGSISVIAAGKVSTFSLPPGYEETTVNALHAEGQALWIATESGLFVWEGDQIGKLELGGFPGDAHVKSFVHPVRGMPLAIVTREAVYIHEGGGAKQYYRPGDPEVHLFDAEWDESGNLLIAARMEAMIRVSPDGTERSFGDDPAIPSQTFTSVTRDQEGAYWFTSRFGICRFAEGKFQSFTTEEGLPSPDIRDACVDHEGNLWLASYGSGLIRFAGLAVASYTSREGLTSNAVMSIARDTRGRMWFSTFDQGICRQNGDTIVAAGSGELGAGSRVWASLAARDGSLWFGTSEGLFLHSGERILRRFDPADSLPDRTVLCLYESQDGRIWVGTGAGLCSVDRGAVTRLDSVKGYPQSRIRGITGDRSGNIWMATRDGVYRFDGSEFRRFGTEEGLPELSAYCIASDERNRIWAGTQAGIAVYEGSRFKEVPLAPEGPVHTINFIHSGNGKLWVGTLNGLWLREVNSGHLSNGGWTAFGEEDGMRSLETNLNAVCETEHGVLWVGTPDGVMRISTALLQNIRKPFKPKLNLSAILINLQRPEWKKLGLVPDALTGFPPTVQVSHANRHFTFYCEGISLRYPSKLEYQYWLEGLEENWEPPTDADFAVFGNLPFGGYTFHARARVAGGEWSQPLSYSFTVRPPFWFTWWFILLSACGLSVIVVWLVRSRERERRRQRDQEMAEMKSRMLALEQQSLNTNMNRHFIFNALNSIQYYINRQDRMAANRYLTDFARLIRKNLDSSQDEFTTLRDELERLELYLRLEHMRFRDKFEYRIQVSPDVRPDEVRMPAMLLQPFLENSIWHGLLPKESAGWVVVDVSRNGPYLELTITDNGIGIEHSLRSKEGTGSHISKGMEITASRIELLRRMSGMQIELIGPHQMNDPEGNPEGTRVCIRIAV